MKITSIHPQSPLFGLVRPGYKLLRINGENVVDSLDYAYRLGQDKIALEFRNNNGKDVEFILDSPGILGLSFEPDKIHRCINKCIFCFVHQQPRGLRKTLYVKDDDYRLSFTHGNFITMSNLSRNDLKRIIEQRLSPLYVSVHTVDDSLRRRLFGNPDLPPLRPQLKYLADNGIQFHTQIVVCPGVNDGDVLMKSIFALHDFYPAVKTLGVVPVGLTKYRRQLPAVSPVSKSEAGTIIDAVHKLQKHFLADTGSRFVFLADEFYILAERPVPRLGEYEEMEQFENGIGMLRLLITDYNRRKRFLKNGITKKPRRVAVLTGEAACRILYDEVILDLKNSGLPVMLIPVKNRFWGKNVTVSGLLTGRDLLGKIKEIENDFEFIILPPNCLNDDNLFLDNLSLEQLRQKTTAEIGAGSYSMVDSLKGIWT